MKSVNGDLSLHIDGAGADSWDRCLFFAIGRGLALRQQAGAVTCHAEINLAGRVLATTVDLAAPLDIEEDNWERSSHFRLLTAEGKFAATAAKMYLIDAQRERVDTGHPITLIEEFSQQALPNLEQFARRAP
jgi:hypothetical protein